MERDLYQRLLAWKSSPARKPLILRGARQTGKTTLLKQLGEREYERVVYLDFERDPALDSFFQRDLDPTRILTELSTYVGFEVEPDEHLLVFDEIQASDRALTALKYFREGAPRFHVAAAGSLLGIQMARPGSFPVGNVSFFDLHPMSFLEFLRAVGRPGYADLLAALDRPEPLPEAIHTDLIALLREHLFVGGMPEAVRTYADTRSERATRDIQRGIVDSFVLDFAKHAPATDIPKLGMLWDSLPRHLAKENKKFMFSAVRKGARARGYENALRWLRDAGLVHLCHAVSTGRPPLRHYADENVFKMYALDVGLLGALARTPHDLPAQGDRAFTEYRGALAESYVAQTLVASGHPELHYWRSTGGKAELDFLCDMDGYVLPVEVKSGVNMRSRSLASFEKKFAPSEMVRAGLRNLKRDGKITNVPLYAVSRLGQVIDGPRDM